MNILFLDLETTGLNPKTSAILEIGAEFYADFETNWGLPNFTFSRKVRYNGTPETQLGALGVNHVKLTETIAPISEAPKFPSLYPTPLFDFVDWLIEVKKSREDFVVCGHNVSFDINFLETKLNDFNISDIKGLVGYRFLDTAALGQFFILAGLLPPETKASADAMAKSLNLTPGGHTSMGDNRASRDTLRALLEKVKPK